MTTLSIFGQCGTITSQNKFMEDIKMKIKALILICVLVTVLFTACTKKVETTPADTTTAETTAAVDAVATASLVDTPEALIKAVGPDANWIVALLKDVVVDGELVVEGEYEKADKDDATKMVPAGRKIALYTQDADRKKTGTFTLTATKMTVKSLNTKIQGGTFIGDVYVEADGFNLVDAIITGNIYFATQANKDSFVLDEKSKVSGTTEVQ